MCLHSPLPASSGFDLVFLGFFITTVRNHLSVLFVQQALYGVVSLNAPSNIGMESGGIAHNAGGFVFGAILGPLLGLFGPE